MSRRKYDIGKSDGLCGTLFPPDGKWAAPGSLPDLTHEKAIGLDIETHDPHLTTRGPGFLRGDAKVVGVSIATNDRSWYLPIDHLGGGNLDRGNVIRYLRDILQVQDRYIVGAGLQYELEGLSSLGVEVRGRLVDVQLAEALIDEERDSYKLDDIAITHLGKGKDETLLRDAAAAYGVDPKNGLWKLPAKYVGPYAEWDARAPLMIFEKQLEILKREDLEGIFTLESKLLPVLWLMRKRGIRIDLEGADVLRKKLRVEEDALRIKMRDDWGAKINEYSGDEIGRVCDHLKINYPRSGTGKPSFEADFLDNAEHPFLQMVSDLRELSGLRSKFIDKWIFDNHVNGIIHPRWKQIASDDGGTRTGRMAASDPNPQQIPAGKYRKTGKPNEIGRAIRRLFVPMERGMRWQKCDYDQQEPRILVHFAALCGCTGAKLQQQAFQRHGYKPKSAGGYDLYKPMSEAAGLDMRPTKDCYLGRCYGMGVKKLAMKFNKTETEAKSILEKFDCAAPYVKEMADLAMSKAQERGYIRTLLGRRRHFNFWEPTDAYNMRKENQDVRPVTLKQAEEKWPGMRLQRANTHKSLNALIQGSAADMTKAAMVHGYETLGEYPYMQVHDELNHGIVDDAHGLRIHDGIQHCVDSTVPVVSKREVGDHWQ